MCEELYLVQQSDLWKAVLPWFQDRAVVRVSRVAWEGEDDVTEGNVDPNVAPATK